MALEGEPEKINTELTKNAVEIRQIIQDFPLCSTFKEIDEQNALGTDIWALYEIVTEVMCIPVRGRLEVMRGNLSRLEVMARESLDLATSELVMTTAERHREQLTACQRQFRLANVKVKYWVNMKQKDVRHNSFVNLGDLCLRSCHWFIIYILRMTFTFLISQ